MLEKKLTTKEDLSKTIMAGFMDKRCKGKNCCFHYAVEENKENFYELYSTISTKQTKHRR